jgi:hypothetical protein
MSGVSGSGFPKVISLAESGIGLQVKFQLLSDFKEFGLCQQMFVKLSVSNPMKSIQRFWYRCGCTDIRGEANVCIFATLVMNTPKNCSTAL